MDWISHEAEDAALSGVRPLSVVVVRHEGGPIDEVSAVHLEDLACSEERAQPKQHHKEVIHYRCVSLCGHIMQRCEYVMDI